MVIFSSDLVAKLESEIQRVFRETREDLETVPQDVGETIRQLLEQSSEEERRKVLDRLARRNDGRHDAETNGCGAALAVASLPATSFSLDEQRFRSATLERELRDLKAANTDLQEQLHTAQTEAAGCANQLGERSKVLRTLERRDESAQEEIAKLKDQIALSLATSSGLEAKLHESERRRAESSQRVIELEIRLHQQATEKPAKDSPMPSSGLNATPAPIHAPAPLPPTKSDAAVSPSRNGVREKFVAVLVQNGLLPKAEAESLPADIEARLGEFAALLLGFQQKVCKIVEAQLSTLAERQPGVQKLTENLKALGRGDRLWLWSLTFGGKKQNPLRSFELYLSELHRLNLCLLAGFHWAFSKAVKENASKLVNPFVVQREAKKQDFVDFWEFYEQNYHRNVPNQLADQCLQQAVVKIEELYVMERP